MVVKMLRGAGQGRYIVINSGVSLFNNINKYSGVRLLIEKFCLIASLIFYKPLARRKSTIVHVYKCLLELEGKYGCPEKAFFLDTSWYKESHFVGSIHFSDSRGFLKYFKETGESRKEAKNLELISELYSTDFEFSKIDFIGDYLIVYKLIDNTGEQCVHDYMSAAAIKMYNKFSSASKQDLLLSQLAKQTYSMLDALDMLGDRRIHFGDLIKRLEGEDSKLKILHCHGDFTTWNTVIHVHFPYTKYLVDYESCRERVLYTDLFHLFTQKPCLERKEIDVLSMLSGFSIKLNQTIDEMVKYYLGYLFEEIQCNLDMWKSGKRHPRLLNLVEMQLSLVVESYAHMQVE